MQEVNSYFQMRNLFLKVELSNVKYRVKYRLAYIFPSSVKQICLIGLQILATIFNIFVEPT